MQKGTKSLLLFLPRGAYIHTHTHTHTYTHTDNFVGGGRRGPRAETNGSNKPINVGRLKRRIFINILNDTRARAEVVAVKRVRRGVVN